MKFSIRDILWLTVVGALGVAWAVDRTRLAADVSRLEADVKRQAAGPDWAGMDRIMDEYYQHWKTLQERERALGLEPTPNPTEQ